MSGFVYLNTLTTKVICVSNSEAHGGLIPNTGVKRIWLSVYLRIGYPEPFYFETHPAGESPWVPYEKDIESVDGRNGDIPIVSKSEKQERLKKYVTDLNSFTYTGHGHFVWSGIVGDILNAILYVILLLILFEAVFRWLRRKSEMKNGNLGSP